MCKKEWGNCKQQAELKMMEVFVGYYHICSREEDPQNKPECATNLLQETRPFQG